MFNLASLAKTVQRYALDQSKSDEKFLNELLSPYVLAAKVRMRGGAEFYLDKGRASKILACKDDVPRALRDALGRYGLEEDTAAGFSDYVEDCLDSKMLDTLAEEVMGLCCDQDDAESALRVELEHKKSEFPAFLAHALIAAVEASNVIEKRGVIWSRGAGSLNWETGDLFKHGFGNRRKGPKNIVVIPANTAFDVHVARKHELADNSLVSERTLHGVWLDRILGGGLDEPGLKARIDDYLDRSGQTRLEDGTWPIGTIAVIEEDNAIYYLLAASRFDENGNAHATRAEIMRVLSGLADFYDRRGQGLDLYIPLIGTGMSRTGFSNRDSFDAISDAFASGSAFVAGKVTIVVMPEVADQLGLGD